LTRRFNSCFSFASLSRFISNFNFFIIIYCFFQQKAEENFQEWKKAKDEAEKKAAQAAKEKALQEKQEAEKKREVKTFCSWAIAVIVF